MERVLTIRGNRPTRPISDFALLARGLGDVYYVDSNNGNDAQSGRSPETAVATLDYAIGLCTANQGDVIYVLAGHAETVATAGAIDADVAGISIIGLGEGGDRPTFTFSAVDATMTIAAASILVKNVLIKPSIDAVVSPIVVSAPGCSIDIEIQDATALIECECGILTTADADNLEINLKYRGFIAGDACLTPIKLVGVDTARICVDFYGVADTAVVEFSGTNCHDIDITGLFYNNGTTLTKNVVDSAGGSTWSVRGWDGNSNANFSGGDNAALASDDVTALATAIGTVDTVVDGIQTDLSNATDGLGALKALVDGVETKVDTLDTVADGIQTDLDNATDGLGALKTLVDGVETKVDTLDTVADGIQTDLGNATDGLGALKALIDTAQSDLDILTGATGVNLLTATQASIDAIETDTDTTIPGLIATAQADLDILTGVTGANLLTATQASIDAIEVDTSTTIPATIAALPKCIAKLDGACLNAADPLFTISGGPVRCKIVGLVTTVIGATPANFSLQHVTVSPVATVELNTAPVAIEDDDPGTFYYNIGAGSVFTPSAALGIVKDDPVTVEETEFLLAPGTLQCLGSAANTGVIAWYMTFTPLSPLSVVTVAA